MSDLKSQLAARFGAPSPEPEPPTPAADPGILGEFAHVDTPWLVALRKAARSLPSPPEIGPRPKLAHAMQVTGQVMRELKAAERKGQSKELAGLRDDWLARRDKAAWAAVKLIFAEYELPDRAYRALKQEGAEPFKALERLRATPRDELSAMGATRLKALLTG